jgi:predicted CXXCH cytochrome family protein
VRFCLVRKASAGGAPKGTSEARGILIHSRRLTIGRAASQHLQLSSPGVEPRHAVLTTGTLGGLRVAPLTGKAILVNGRREIRARRIAPGDVIEIGTAKLTIHPTRSRRAVILEVQEPDADSGAGHEEAADLAPQGPRMSPWSWGLSLGCALLFLLLPLSGLVMPGIQEPLRETPLLPSDSLWSPGPLHTAHQSIGTRCDACHVKPFEAVRDQACFVCHAVVAHHVDIRSPDVKLFRDKECTSCHLEHKQPAALVQRDPRLCTECHGDLKHLDPNTRVLDATDFGAEHPEFRLTVLASTPTGHEDRSLRWQAVRLDRNDPEHFVEHSHLKFSHLQHLNPKGVKSPTGERVLSCQDCHRPNSSGRDMIPIRMETQCSGCHSLRFDEHDPTSGVPHGDVEAVYKTLREHFSRAYLVQSGSGTAAAGSRQLRRPGGEQRVLTEKEQRRAREWVDEQSLKIARELLEKRVCADCHEVTRDPAGTGLEQWHVEPVRLTSNWMPRARFDHAAHISETCVSCHSSAPKSRHATDILLPDIARCRECHGGTQSPAKVASDCLMCHPFHIPSRGAWLRTTGKSTQAAR